MDTEYTKEQLKQRHANLPDELKEALESTETDEIIWEIGKNHNLHIDQIGILSKTLGYFFLGLIHPKNFKDQVQKNLALSDDEANLIVYDLNQKLLLKLRNLILTLHEPTAQTTQIKEDGGEKVHGFSNKMNSILNLPKEEVEVVNKNGDNRESLKTQTIDPYREAL